MKLKLSLLAAWCGLAFIATAAVPAPEKLLPGDTLILLTAPDWDGAKAAFRDFPMSQLWRDPEMKPFVTKFEGKLKSDVFEPLERELGVKLGEYAELARGQLTFALVQNGWEGQSDKAPAWLVLVDSKDKSDLLKAKLTDLKKRWTDSGKQVKTERIRDVEFMTLITSSEEIDKAFSAVFPDKPGETDETPKAAAKKFELTAGQAGSLLILGDSTAVIEKVLIRLSGGSVPALSEQPRYESTHNAMFREATVYAWADAKALYQILLKAMKTGGGNGDAAGENPLGFTPEKLLASLGLDALNTLAIKSSANSEGLQVDMLVGAPQAERRGIFKVLSIDAKESAPPAFVPTDVTKFNRWRMDGKKLWSTIEGVLAELSPAMNGIVQMMLETAGKDKDPNFNLKTQLIGNLGDDMIGYEKPPRSTQLVDLLSPPSLFLLSSPDAPKLAEAIKTAVGSFVPGGAGGDGAAVKEREFLGRRIYSVSAGPSVSPDGSRVVQRMLSFAASGGYVAISQDAAALEEYLRAGEAQSKPLREATGLNEAAQRVGGMGTGVFGYEKQNETLRAMFTALKKNPDLFDQFMPPVPGARPGATPRKAENRWLDFSLLPPFERVEKYFHWSVYSLSATPEGLMVRGFSPTPPALRK
ncbi:MAG: hypothetical protein AB1705_01885 [Verrucomicrobiota bacterium]